VCLNLANTIIFDRFFRHRPKINQIPAHADEYAWRGDMSSSSHIKSTQVKQEKGVERCAAGGGAQSRIAEHECVTAAARPGHLSVRDDGQTLRDGQITADRHNGYTCNSIYYKSLRALDMLARERGQAQCAAECLTVITTTGPSPTVLYTCNF